MTDEEIYPPQWSPPRLNGHRVGTTLGGGPGAGSGGGHRAEPDDDGGSGYPPPVVVSLPVSVSPPPYQPPYATIPQAGMAAATVPQAGTSATGTPPASYGSPPVSMFTPAQAVPPATGSGQVPAPRAYQPRPLERTDARPTAGEAPPGDRYAPQVYGNGRDPYAVRPDVGWSDPGRPEAARPDPGRPEAARPDAGRPEAARPDVGWSATSRSDALVPHDTAARREPAIQVDYEVVAALQAEVSRLVIEELRGETSVSNEQRRRVTRELTEVAVRRNVDLRLRSGETGPVSWPGYERALADAVAAYLIGLGRLQPLIDDPDVENIMVLGTRVRVVFANGVVDETSYTAAASDEELIGLLQRLAERGGRTERSLSSAKPILHLRLPDGARLTVIYQVTSRPVVVIRRHRVRDVSLTDLIGMDMVTPTLAAFLQTAVRAHMNVMIAGRANAGKTTLLRAMADEIPPDEWFCVLETVAELGLDTTGRHPWAVCFEEREGFGERGTDGRPEGQLTVDDLFPHMLRLSASRIIVGEVRAEEIVAMFDAMNTTYGSLCTIHSRDEHGVFDRLAELLLRYGASKNREGAYLTIGNALDLVVYVNMDERPGFKPRRYVSSVMEVHGLGEGRQLARSRLFAPGPNGMAVPTTVRPSERRAAELQSAGFDMRLLLTPGYADGVR